MADRARPLGGLLARDPVVVTAGEGVFADALAAQGVPVRPVDWRPPPSETEAALTAVLSDPGHVDANARAVERLVTARPQLVDVRPARDVLDLDAGTFLHAGPPLDWERASGPMRGALIGAMLLEGLAETPLGAEHALERGAATLESCHAHATVGPMAGVVSPSMWMLVVEDAEYGGTAYCPLNEGLGKVLRFGSYGPDVIDRLDWMGEVLGPVLQAAVRTRGPLDLTALIAEALRMGDELHGRNRAATSLLLRELAPALLAAEDVPRDRAAAALRFTAGNDQFFLNVGMAAAKACADAARNVPGSSLVVAMAANGTDFGVQVSGTGDRWFTVPASVPEGRYLGGHGPDDANPDLGDAAIVETAGMGGFALAAAPAVVRSVGGDVPGALAATHRMYEITLAEHPLLQIPLLSFRGTPVGVDVARVVRTGIPPVIDTGIAGRAAGTGQVGAGLVEPPRAVFTAALTALAEIEQGRG
ncbi:DUF1116 domain-containing protein [Actinomadura meridiana]|uniref:DUF1116 domain-containing protein n=1 Tax=Actinomadura meridiana TaxID=559626 RepID=UPI0031E7EF6D